MIQEGPGPSVILGNSKMEPPLKLLLQRTNGFLSTIVKAENCVKDARGLTASLFPGTSDNGTLCRIPVKYQLPNNANLFVHFLT
jgi:hypothetical protein